MGNFGEISLVFMKKSFIKKVGKFRKIPEKDDFSRGSQKRGNRPPVLAYGVPVWRKSLPKKGSKKGQK
jgi:hypothetical protein